MELVKGDLFKLMPKDQPVIIPHVCNDEHKWGRGFVVPLCGKYPKARDVYLNSNIALGHNQLVEVRGSVETNDLVVVANMIAQSGLKSQSNPRPLKYHYLVECMLEIRERVYGSEEFDDITFSIHCPKFGSGLAGGNWNFISDLINDIWGDISVTVYEL